MISWEQNGSKRKDELMSESRGIELNMGSPGEGSSNWLLPLLDTNPINCRVDYWLLIV
jgi:hypothetical protein